MISLSNKVTSAVLFVVVVVILAVGAYSYNRPPPNPGYGADSILISVGGQEMTLQAAITQNLFGDKSGGIDFTQCSTHEGMCADRLSCPPNYVIVRINRGERCGGDGRYPSAIKCCKLH
jgi:hypothetical protein